MEIVSIPGVERVNIPAAVVVYSRKKDQARAFIEFLAGPTGQKVFAEHGYITEP